MPGAQICRCAGRSSTFGGVARRPASHVRYDSGDAPSVAARDMLTEVPLHDGQPRDGNFGVLIHDGLAFASDPNAGTIQTFELDAMSKREVLVMNYEAPDGMAWTPVRVNVMTQP